MKKQNFLKISLKGTFVYIILVIVLSIIYSKLVVIVPKFDVSNEYLKVINKVQKMVCYSDLYTWLAFNKKCNAIIYIDEKKFEIPVSFALHHRPAALHGMFIG